MEYYLKDKKVNLIINKKLSKKNLTLIIDDDMNIVINSNYFITNKYIYNFIDINKDKIIRMLDSKLKEKEYYFLGKKIEKVDNYDKFLKKNIKKYTELIIDDIVNNFTYSLPKFTIRYRKMKTRWGVCNNKLKVITLNTLLIKKDLKYLNYVIVHELSHFIYQNHSKDFWNVVEENCKDYKKIISVIVQSGLQ